MTFKNEHAASLPWSELANMLKNAQKMRQKTATKIALALLFVPFELTKDPWTAGSPVRLCSQLRRRKCSGKLRTKGDLFYSLFPKSKKETCVFCVLVKAICQLSKSPANKSPKASVFSHLFSLTQLCLPWGVALCGCLC